MSYFGGKSVTILHVCTFCKRMIMYSHQQITKFLKERNKTVLFQKEQTCYMVTAKLSTYFCILELYGS